ncbi:MAG: ferrous iron transport protein A [Treponema sp.]|nr:ferrous iron transport protein A [Treponema sp.]
MPIYMAQIGEEYLIKKIGGLEETKHHLKNLGFVPGSQVSVVSVMGGNLIVQIKDARVAISKEQAGKIII